MLAITTALGSSVNSYMHADLVADLIGNYRADYVRALKRHTRLSEASALAAHPAAREEVDSVGREHDALGRAAVARVTSLKWGVLRRNPHVFGHGDAAPSLGIVGRRPRADAPASEFDRIVA
jgi:hypothetical protein